MATPKLAKWAKGALDSLRSVISFNSASNIVMTPSNRLVVLVKKASVDRAIPEAGDILLIGGANGGLLDVLSSKKALADAHLLNALNVEVPDECCSDFVHAEYAPEDCGKVNTGFGPLAMLRIAFDRVVILTDDLFDAMFKASENMVSERNGRTVVEIDHPKGEYMMFLTEEEFEEIVESGDCSFPFQVDHVRQAFALNGEMPKPVGFYAD